MKIKLIEDYDDKHRKGFEVTVDRILYSIEHTGYFKVRVIGMHKKPTWMAITWFIKIPAGRQ